MNQVGLIICKKILFSEFEGPIFLNEKNNRVSKTTLIKNIFETNNYWMNLFYPSVNSREWIIIIIIILFHLRIHFLRSRKFTLIPSERYQVFILIVSIPYSIIPIRILLKISVLNFHYVQWNFFSVKYIKLKILSS